MEKINELFENELSGIIHAYPSIYTKDDVSELLSKLRTAVLTEVSELKPASAITEDRFQEFSESVTKSLENKINRGDIDVYDYSSAEFSINDHKTVEMESLEFNTDSLVDELATILQDQFVGYFGELKQE